MLENVSEDGKELSGCLGRHQNPGEEQGGLGASQKEVSAQPGVLGFRYGERLETAFLLPPLASQGPGREGGGAGRPGWGVSSRRASLGWTGRAKLSAWEGLLGGWGSSEQLPVLGREEGRHHGLCRGLSPSAWGRIRCLPYPEPSPGHALEAGWFLLRHAIRKGDPELRAHVVDKFLLLPFRSGWDPDHGGLFYFQDADGLCPTQVGMCPGPQDTNPFKAFCSGRFNACCHHPFLRRGPGSQSSEFARCDPSGKLLTSVPVVLNLLCTGRLLGGTENERLAGWF